MIDTSDYQGLAIAIIGNLHAVMEGITWMQVFTVILGLMQAALIIRKWLYFNKLDEHGERRKKKYGGKPK